MTDFKISICYMSYRPGGFDILAGSLTRQTYKNYELIVIDDYKGRNLQRWLEEKGIPVRYYGPMKPKSNSFEYNQCNVANTALMYATGEIFIVLQDYAWMPPDALQKWNDKFNNVGLNNIIVGCGREYLYFGSPIVNDITAFPAGSFSMDDFRFFKSWIPTGLELFYTGFSTKYLLDINGFDERGDEWCVMWWDSVLAQAKLNGVNIIVDKSNFVHVIDHRQWSVGDKKLWHIVRTSNIKSGSDVEWLKVSPNKFNIKEMRQRVK